VSVLAQTSKTPYLKFAYQNLELYPGIHRD
jgi:hypothetical protein